MMYNTDAQGHTRHRNFSQKPEFLVSMRKRTLIKQYARGLIRGKQMAPGDCLYFLNAREDRGLCQTGDQTLESKRNEKELPCLRSEIVVRRNTRYDAGGDLSNLLGSCQTPWW
jgi:hypothetical protein